MLISSTEPPELRSIGTSSQLPEKYGSDILFRVNTKLAGIQRKEFSDLVASVNDGRLNKELAQMQALDHRLLIVEGEPRWSLDGVWLGNGSFTRARFHGLMLDVQFLNCSVLMSSTVTETIALVSQYEKHLREPRELNGRPKPKGEWGRASSRDWAVYMLQGLGLGPKTAGNVYDVLGIPLQWTVTEQELMCVPGVGKNRAKKLIGALDGQSSNPAS